MGAETPQSAEPSTRSASSMQARDRRQDQIADRSARASSSVLALEPSQDEDASALSVSTSESEVSSEDGDQIVKPSVKCTIVEELNTRSFTGTMHCKSRDVGISMVWTTYGD